MLGRIIVRIETQQLSDEERERTVVRHLLSHFGDREGLGGFVDHLDDGETAAWRDLVLDVVKEFTADKPRKPYSMWEDVDESFRDVITQMTSLDPKRRITAREALQHPYFRDVCNR